MLIATDIVSGYCSANLSSPVDVVTRRVSEAVYNALHSSIGLLICLGIVVIVFVNGLKVQGNRSVCFLRGERCTISKSGIRGKSFAVEFAERLSESGTPLLQQTHVPMLTPQAIDHSEVVRISSIARTLAEEITVRHIARQNPFLVLEDCEECAYIRSLNGEITFSNTRYNMMFGISRQQGSKYFAVTDWNMNLQEATLDRIMQNGVQSVHITYAFAIDGDNFLPVVTSKVLLDGCRDSRFGWVNVVRLTESHNAQRCQVADHKTRESWKRFQTLTEKEQLAAIGLAIGEQPAIIADRIGTSSRTIENYRVTILSTMRVTNTNQLGLVLCRIQDLGLAEFGI